MQLWPHPAIITRNNFKAKSLSCWSYNIAIGCTHGCTFCYVPQVSTSRGPLAKKLADLGVADPDADWGNYAFLREWDEPAFLRSLRTAQATPDSELNPDGNRAIMLCTTTDPYMVMPDKACNEHRRLLVRRALELIRDHSTLNVRILTRSPLARQDFDLFKSFGRRLLFGMSLPSMDDKLCRLYEPHAPGPLARYKCLEAARAAGLHVFIAMAPTFPECSEEDISRTLCDIAALEPVTVFHEPINIRGENVARIAQQAAALGLTPRSEVFADTKTWSTYALDQLALVATLAKARGLAAHLHPWPDPTLAKRARTEPERTFITQSHTRISEWPTW